MGKTNLKAVEKAENNSQSGKEIREAFDKIYDETFDAESLISAIRYMAALFQEGVHVGYDYTDFINLAAMAKEKCDKIIELAEKTDGA